MTISGRRTIAGLGWRGVLTLALAAAALLGLVGAWASVAGSTGEVTKADAEKVGAEVESATAALPASTPSAQASPEMAYVPSLRIWVHPDGVRPALVRSAPGKVTLRVENETGGDAALVVQRVLADGGRGHVTRVATRDRGRRARQDLHLGVGEYVFFDEARPLLVGRLVVGPQGE